MVCDLAMLVLWVGTAKEENNYLHTELSKPLLLIKMCYVIFLY